MHRGKAATWTCGALDGVTNCLEKSGKLIWLHLDALLAGIDIMIKACKDRYIENILQVIVIPRYEYDIVVITRVRGEAEYEC